MSIKAEKIQQILQKIRATTPEIIGATIVSVDGFIIASLLPNEVDEDLIGGMAASLLGVSERISSDLMHSQMEQVFLRSPRGYIIINASGPDSALVILVSPEAKLGMIFLEIRRAILELNKFLQ